jgi:hypothetical protein
MILDNPYEHHEAGAHDLERLVTAVISRLGDPFPIEQDQRESVLAALSDAEFDELDR